jgi:phospholipase/carboxylesterase
MIDGPRVPPASGGKPDSLVVFLHGYGANGADLISLAPYWQKLLPRSQFLAPDAPTPVPGSMSGYQWFPITNLNPAAMAGGVKQAGPIVERYLLRECERYGLPMSRVALVGFSQGTMMSLSVGLRHKGAAPAAIVGFSGVLADGADLKTAKSAKPPPVLLIHGSADDVIPLPALFSSAQQLAEAEIPVEWRISYGVGHGIAPDGLERAGGFLKRALNAR